MKMMTLIATATAIMSRVAITGATAVLDFLPDIFIQAQSVLVGIYGDRIICSLQSAGGEGIIENLQI